VEGVGWVMDLSISIYNWTKEALEGIIGNINKGVGFVDDFPEIIGDFLKTSWTISFH
jgi:hypothetical protein